MARSTQQAGFARRVNPTPARTDEGPAVWTCLAIAAALAFLGSIAAAEAASAPGSPPILATLWRWTPLIFSGFLFNLLVSVLSMLLGTAAGVLLGLAQISPHASVRRIAWAITQFFRNAPWLVLLFYAMFLIPFEVTIFGIQVAIPAWIKAVIGLALPVMANVSEVVRGGIVSIPAGQWESAEALAFSRRQILWLIILPQAIKRMIPPWMNLYAILTMATSTMSIVGVQEVVAMTKGALVAEGRLELFIPMYAMALLFFFAYCYPIARWTAALERRFSVKG
ncbi:MAG: amino acid ABC transporter permease [Betaproteobacteria bacterium]